MEVSEDAKDEVKQTWLDNKSDILEQLTQEFGASNSESKIRNFIELGSKPFSILAFHNKFFEQVRRAFVIGAYYPALTAACALGERILNHLILALRDDFSSSPQYKRVYSKESFDDWNLAIGTLDSWKILLPKSSAHLRQLAELRNQTLHFRPETDSKDRELALQANSLLSAVISEQFPSFGSQPWFITGIPGEIYIKKEAEGWPFVREIYLPNCDLVGPRHIVDVTEQRVFVANDATAYEDVDITDEQFCEYRKAFKQP